MLSLPASWALAAVVIVLQSLAGFPGRVLFLRWVPKHLFPSTLPGRVPVAH